MALDATAGGLTANSYATEAEADEILVDGRLYGELWVAASSAVREQALRFATRILDESFDFDGSKTDIEQALRWPRIGAYDREGDLLDSDTIPQQVKNATAEIALELLRGDPDAIPDLLTLGISEAKVGPLQVKLDRDFVRNLTTDSVVRTLFPLGRLNSDLNQVDGGIGNVPIWRA